MMTPDTSAQRALLAGLLLAFTAGPCLAGIFGSAVGTHNVAAGWVVAAMTWAVVVAVPTWLVFRGSRRRHRAQFDQYQIGENRSWE